MSTNLRSEVAEDGGVEIPAEHIVSPELRKRLQQCYEHGKRLLAQEKRDHDYANTMFTQCVVKDPSNLVYLEAFLGNLQDKYKNNKKGARGLSLGGGATRGEFKKALTKKQWVDVLRIGPELLKTNPWDVPILRAMAQACEALRYNEVELRYLKNALDANPKDLDINRHCARSLARMGQFDQAIACWHRIEELRPNDTEAPKMISELTVERNRPQAGFGPSLTPRRSANAASESKPDSDSSSGITKRREIQLTPVQRLERAIADDPTMIEHYLELIDLHVQEQRLAEAERVLQRAQSVSPGDLDVLAKGEDLVIGKAKQQIQIAEQRLASERTEEARKLVEQLRENLLRTELQIYDARSQRFPQDAALKYRVAVCLKRVGNFREAAQRFQEARAAPEFHLPATIELGECLQHLKQYVKALHCYVRAAEKSADQPDAAEMHKVALYRAGVLAAAMRELDVARSTLSKLVTLDPAYKDARDRLDKLPQISDKN